MTPERMERQHVSGSLRDPLAAEVAAAAQLACLLEATAPKPGNVSPGRHFEDASFEEFLASAAAIGIPLAGAGVQPLGATIREAVESTSRWTRSNTNLGIVLLLAPLARAAFAAGRQQVRSTPLAVSRPALRAAVRQVLHDASTQDACDVYAAIRHASPGGLGRADDQDVGQEPSKPLLDVMRLAADRDGIAREYSTAFEVTFEQGAPALDAARRDRLSWDDAVVETYLVLLAATPDTHVMRRAGAGAAAAISARAGAVLAAGGVRTAAGRRTIEEMDRALRDPRQRANPGTTADLTAAAIFVVLVTGGWLTPGRDGDPDRRNMTHS